MHTHTHALSRSLCCPHLPLSPPFSLALALSLTDTTNTTDENEGKHDKDLFFEEMTKDWFRQTKTRVRMTQNLKHIDIEP